jgi:hypothetical protein
MILEIVEVNALQARGEHHRAHLLYQIGRAQVRLQCAKRSKSLWSEPLAIEIQGLADRKPTFGPKVPIADGAARRG